MTVLDKRKAYIHLQEQKVREHLGLPIDIRLQVGIIYPPDAVWDEVYQVYRGPDGKPVEGTPEYETHTIYVLVKWLKGEEVYETKVGLLKAGNCILTADIDDEGKFRKALDQRAVIRVGGADMNVVEITRMELEISIEVACQRV